jgi:tetratricopeptide (TPR) repeat protein
MSHQVQLSPAAAHCPPPSWTRPGTRLSQRPAAADGRTPPARHARNSVPPWKSDLLGPRSHPVKNSGRARDRYGRTGPRSPATPQRPGDRAAVTGGRDYRAAAEALEAALTISRDLGDRGGEAELLSELGTLHRVRGDLDQAVVCHRQALDLAREIDSSWDEAHALAGLGRCALAAGRTANAGRPVAGVGDLPADRRGRGRRRGRRAGRPHRDGQAG